jgi:hypothetical protein
MDARVSEEYEIFQGRYHEKDVMWVDVVKGLDAAKSRMEALSARAPGPYFVFCTRTRTVMATADTSNSPRATRSA